MWREKLAYDKCRKVSRFWFKSMIKEQNIMWGLGKLKKSREVSGTLWWHSKEQNLYVGRHTGHSNLSGTAWLGAPCIESQRQITCPIHSLLQCQWSFSNCYRSRLFLGHQYLEPGVDCANGGLAFSFSDEFHILKCMIKNLQKAKQHCLAILQFPNLFSYSLRQLFHHSISLQIFNFSSMFFIPS